MAGNVVAPGAAVTVAEAGIVSADTVRASETGNMVYSQQLDGKQNGVRGSDGRFVVGHPGGPGRKPRAQEQAALSAINSVMKPETIEALLQEALQLARETRSWRGTLACVELALAYQLGKPTQRINVSETQTPADWLQALLDDVGAEPDSGVE